MVANLWKTHRQPSRLEHIALLLVTILPLALLLLNCLALWIFFQDFSLDTPTFYWRHYHNELVVIQLVTCLALPFAGVVSTVVNLLSRRTPWISLFNITLLLPLIGFWFFISYLLVFLGGSYDDGGEVTLGDNRYALVKIHPYDSEGAIYLGTCDLSGDQCRFHEICSTVLSDGTPPSVQLSPDGRLINVTLDGHIVYTTDGLNGSITYPPDFYSSMWDGFCLRY